MAIILCCGLYLHPYERGSALPPVGVLPEGIVSERSSPSEGFAADSRLWRIPAIHGIYFDSLLRKEAENQDLGSPPAAPP